MNDALEDQGLRSLAIIANTPRATLHLCRELRGAEDSLLPCVTPWRAVKVLKRSLIRDPRRVMRERDAMRRIVNTTDSAPPVASPFIANLLRTAKDDVHLFFILEARVHRERLKSLLTSVRQAAVGGPLHRHVRAASGGRLAADVATRYAAEVRRVCGRLQWLTHA